MSLRVGGGAVGCARVMSGRRARFINAHRRTQGVSASRDRLDVPGSVRRISQRLTEFLYGCIETVAIIGGDIRPQSRIESISSNYLAGFFQKSQQQFERFSFYWHRFVAIQQASAAGKYNKSAEMDDALCAA